MGCSSSTLDCSPTEWISPNSDIGGKGVIYSFVLTMAFTIFLSILAFLIPEYPDNIGHPIDRSMISFSEWVWSIGHHSPQPSLRHKLRVELSKSLFLDRLHDHFSNSPGRRWLKYDPATDTMEPAAPGTTPVILRDIIFALCAQQQVVGIAILGARYATCDITVYHSEIVRCLALFSFGTQMTAIEAIRDYLAHQRWMRAISVLLLLPMAGMLMHLNILHGHRDVYDNTPTLANCFFDAGDAGGDPGKWMSVNIVLLLLALTQAVDSVFPKQSVIVWRTPNDAKRLVRDVFFRLHNFYLQAKDGLTWWIWIPTILPFAIVTNTIVTAISATLLLPWLAIWTYFWIFGGLFTSILFDIFWFGWSIWDLLEAQAYADQNMKPEDLAKEATWGFGQVLPMILCVLPILAAVQEFVKCGKTETAELEKVVVEAVPQPPRGDTWDTISPPMVARVKCPTEPHARRR